MNKHNYSQTLSGVAFAGMIVGMLVFGYMSDRLGRKFGMVSLTYEYFVGLLMQDGTQMLATGIVAVFSGLSAASSGAHHSVGGMLSMLSAMRSVNYCLDAAGGLTHYFT